MSAGQRQRLALARALLGDPTVLLLDEADAHLDPASATVVDRVLATFRGTVLLATHRPERLAIADSVWHLDAGRLLEAGSRSSVLAGNGPTAHLFGDG